MRAYSRSQGKIIEVPDQQVNKPSGGSSGPATALGIPDDQLKKMLFLYGLQNPKSASTLKTLYSLVAPAKETAADRAKAKTGEETSYNLSKITRAKELLSKSKTGPIQGRLLELKAKTGVGMSDEDKELYNLLGNIRAMEMFGVGGKALTEAEKSILRPSIPEYVKPTEQNVTALDEMMRRLQGIYSNREAGMETEYPSNVGSNEDDWEDIDL